MLETSSPESYVHKLDGLPDERQCKRVAVRHVALRNPVLGRVVDSTPDGLGIECNRSLRVFDRYSFTLVGGSSKIHKKGEVRWSRLTAAGVDANGEPELVYRVGIAFVAS